MVNIFFVGAPVALYVLLVALPKGRPALKGAIGVALALVAFWLALKLLAPPPNVETVGFFSLLLLCAAWFIASSLQVLRLRLPDTAPGWIWPFVTVLTLGAVSFVFLRLFGF